MAYGGGTFTSDQGSIQMEAVGSNTLARTGRCRITSIQAKGIATSTIVFYDSADASAPGSQVYVAKYGTEGLNTLKKVSQSSSHKPKESSSDPQK